MMIKQCIICDLDFETSNGRMKTCSREHLVSCLECKDTFPRVKTKKFCSMRCGSLYQAKNSKKVECECTVCGDTFMAAKITSSFCSNPHKLSCVICGDEFERKMPSKVRTCSTPCKMSLMKRTNLENHGVENVFQSTSVKEKIKQTNLERYGVDHPMQSEEVKKLQEAALIEKYGVTSPLQNPEVYAKMKAKLLDLHGVDNVSKLESSKKKTRETNLERYGVEHTFQSEEVKDKIKKTNLERFGVESSLQNAEVKEKGKETLLKKHGVDNYSKTDEFKFKIKELSQEKYGTDHFFQAEEIKKKSKETLLNNYGVDNAMKSPLVQEKVEKIVFEKYGAKNIMQTEVGRSKINSAIEAKYGVPNFTFAHMKNLDQWLDMDKFVDENPDLTIYEMAEFFNVNERAAYRKLRREGLIDKSAHKFKASKSEVKWRLFFESLGLVSGKDFLLNDRTILHPKELDFYFPNHKFAVEISPTGTHFYSKDKVWGSKGRGYHRDKFTTSNTLGVELLTIFDWHDETKLKDMLTHKLSKTMQKVSGRKCEISFEVKNSEVRDFISSSHILSFKPYKMIGYTVLRYEGEIVGAAAFTRTNSDDVAELKRLVFKSGFSIQGGASRLLKAFERANLGYTKVKTLSDNDLGSGKVYRTIGFDLIRVSPPQLNYYSIKDDFYVRRATLMQQGTDRLLKNIPGYKPVGTICICVGDKHINGSCLPSAEDILTSYGFRPLYDCGFTEWIYNL